MKNFAVIGCIVLLILACGAAPEETETVSETVSETPLQRRALSSFDPQVDALLADMTLEEKVGQMTQAANNYLESDQDIATYFLGSVLSGGDSDPEAGNALEAWREMAERYQAVAATTRLEIPLLYGVDAVHGHSNVLGAVVFPHHVGLGATRNAQLVEDVYRATAVELRATGVQWDFAPAVPVVRDERWGRTYEGFSEDPEIVAELSAAAVRGLQDPSLAGPLGVVACAKHYVGDGGTAFGTGMSLEGVSASVFDATAVPEGVERFPMDRGDTRLDEAELRRLHMPGYVSAVAAGVATIMPSYSSVNGELCSGSKRLLTEVLKGEMGFDGFLISDWAAVDALDEDYATAIEKSINAGMDMVMVPDRYQEFFAALKSLVEEGRVPMERIDDAVRRILRVKAAAGLLDDDPPVKADRALEERFGSAEHRELARDAVRQSLVVLKNEAALPLSKDLKRIHVAGRNADDLGHQCGGWTITWQGGSGDTTEGTTILEAIRQTVSDDTEVTFSIDGSGAEGADAVIVAIGEEPYAEMLGDRLDLSLDPEDVAVVRRLAETGIPVVTLLISGRPMVIGDVLDSSAAFVAAWWPGSEGQGVADVLFGDFSPTGKLAYSWPRSTEQLPINRGDEDYDPLFEYGHGLSW